MDSLQILEYTPKSGENWCDLGSGAGFPGLAVAIVSAESNPECHVTLVESDKRKCAFLRTVARETDTNLTIENSRIEQLKPLNSDIMSARALAPLSTLMDYASRHLKNTGVAMLPKGATWKQEVSDVQEHWRFTYTAHPSRTNSNAVILEIRELSNV